MLEIKIPKAYQKWAQAAEKQGWTITRCGNNHLRWQPPEGRVVFTPGTPGCGHGGDLRIRAKLRAAGLAV